MARFRRRVRTWIGLLLAMAGMEPHALELWGTSVVEAGRGLEAWLDQRHSLIAA